MDMSPFTSGPTQPGQYPQPPATQPSVLQPPASQPPAFDTSGAPMTKTGTTTVGITCPGGVVMAADQRATMGHLISHKETDKLFRIADNMGFTIAGLVGDAQALARWLSAEVELHRMKRGAPMSIKAASTLLANIMNQRKFAPFMVQLLVGGVDDEGNHVYSIDAAGGSIPDKFTTTGSGSVFVYGVLEDRYEADMDLDAATDLAIRGISAAMKRDSASGDGMNVATITPDKGFQFLTKEEIHERRERMGVL